MVTCHCRISHAGHVELTTSHYVLGLNMRALYISPPISLPLELCVAVALHRGSSHNRRCCFGGENLGGWLGHPLVYRPPRAGKEASYDGLIRSAARPPKTASRPLPALDDVCVHMLHLAYERLWHLL